MIENRKRFRNTGILLATVCVVIGIAVMKQHGKEPLGEVPVADTEERQQTEEEKTGGDLTDDTEAEASDLDKQCGGYHYKILKDGTVEVIAYEGSDTTIFIPAYMENRAVTVIGPEAFKGNKKRSGFICRRGLWRLGRKRLRDVALCGTSILPEQWGR